MNSVVLYKLKQVMEAKGITKEQLIEITGISKNSANRYLRKCRCRNEKARLIAEKLGVDVHDLIWGYNPTPKVEKYDTPCKNLFCRLNKDGICINDVVLTGRGDCANKDVEKSKFKEFDYYSTTGITKNNFKLRRVSDI